MRKGLPAPRLLLLGLVALLHLAASCTDDTEPGTQIVVLMDTDYLVPTEVDRIRARVLRVSEDGGAVTETWSMVFPVSRESDPEQGSYLLPASFGVVPAEADMSRQVTIEVEALAPDGDLPVTKRTVRTRFIENQLRLLWMLLYRACADANCGEGTSCGCADGGACLSPACVDEFIDPQSLELVTSSTVRPPVPEIPVDPGDECEPRLTLCDGECVDTSSDPLFCGSCTTPCAQGNVCDRATCEDPSDCRTNGIDCTGFTYCDADTGRCLRGCDADEQCASVETCDTEFHECICVDGRERCLNLCVDTQTDPRFCGDCETACPSGEVCEVGNCVDLGDCRNEDVECSGFTYCDETNGECLRGCLLDDQCTAANEVCDISVNDCVCDVGFERCPAGVGACVDTQTDPRFCGDCETACPSGEVCDTAVCFDPRDCRANGVGCSGFTYCDPSTGECLRGCDSSPQCGSNEVCNISVNDCVCDLGFERCPAGVGACVDTQTDPRFCGDCGTACRRGEVCQQGDCFDPNDCRENGVECQDFFTYCDPATGECLEGCDSNAECPGDNYRCNMTTNQCICDPGFTRCSAQCVNTLNSEENCGNCGNICGDDEICQQGDCFDPNDCRENGVGCQDFFTYCDPATGDCLEGCDSNAECPGDNYRCNMATNQCVCDPGLQRCGDNCVNTLSNRQNCGGCGIRCGFGQQCIASVCTP